MSSSRRYEERSRSPRRRDRSRTPPRHRDYDSRRYSEDRYEDDRSKRRKYDDERRDDYDSHRRDPRPITPSSSAPRHVETSMNSAPDHPALNSIHRGKISQVKDFGVFVDILGFKKQGLVHVSQVSNYRIERPEDLKEMFAPGDDVLVKVINIDESTGKYSLSIKYVNQRDGTDLDPAGTQAKQAQARKSGERGERPDNRIKLEYKYDVTCQKCGGLGHLASECFSAAAVLQVMGDQESDQQGDLVPTATGSRGGAPRVAAYSMVPENTAEDQWFDVIQMQREMDEAKLRRKEERRVKREERERRRHDKKKKKEKKEKKHHKKEKHHKKKRKRDASSSDSSSSSRSSDSSSSDSESNSRSR